MHSVRPRRSREHRRGKGRQRGTGRARTHQQGSHDSPERDPSCCPHDRPLRRPCPVAQRPAPPGTIIPKSVTNGHGGSRIQGLAAAARLGRPPPADAPAAGGRAGRGRRGRGRASIAHGSCVWVSGVATCRHLSARLPISSSGRALLAMTICVVHEPCRILLHRQNGGGWVHQKRDHRFKVFLSDIQGSFC